MITSEQVQAARALLRWEQKDLAATLKVSLPSINRLENRCHPHSPRIGRRRIHRREWRRFRRAAKENQTENKMTKDNSEERETICLVSDPAYRGGPTIKWPPGYFTPPSEPANKVATTAGLNNALMEATIKELEKLETQFQRYDDILTALTNARRIVARHLRVNLTDPATALKSSNKMRDIASLKPRHAIPACGAIGGPAASIPVEDLTSENDG
jgi:hypothetical protein